MNKLVLFLLLLIIKIICKNKGCSEFDEIKQGFCSLIQPLENKKYCIFHDNGCFESFKECSDYTGKDEAICKSIIPYDESKKCSFIDDNCQSIPKECSDINLREIYLCNEHKPDKENKRCSNINDKCVEQPSDCSYYEGNNKEECESILLLEENSYIKYKCSFSDKGCEKVPISCSDYKPGLSDYDCEKIQPSVGKHCVFINGQCIENSLFCSDLDNKSDCESNYPQSYYSEKCIFKDNKCISQDRECSEYESDKNNLECKLIISYSHEKQCILINNECVERYRDCKNYKGNNKDECETIQLDNNHEGYKTKCAFINGECINVKKSCSDFKNGIKDGSYCEEIDLEDETKHCVYNYGNKDCIEHYKECSSYKGNNKEECESIYPENHYNYKCIFDNNTCKRVKLDCSDYNKNNFKLYELGCQTLKPLDSSKICQISNFSCVEQDKDILENIESKEEKNGEKNEEKNQEKNEEISGSNLIKSYLFISFLIILLI